MTQQLVRGAPDLRVLLRPISDDSPAGDFLLYEGTYDRIKEARRSDDAALPRGVWERDLKAADWPLVESLCEQALESRTKDVQIGVWLLEASMRLRDFRGLREGVEVILRLCEAFWAELHPPLEDDGEFRSAPFHWMNEKLAPSLFDLPVARPRDEDDDELTWHDWKRALWVESVRARNPKDGVAEAEGVVTRDEFEARVEATPRRWYEESAVELANAIELVRDLEALLDREMGERSPSLVRFREHMAEIHGWMRTLVRRAHPAAEEVEPMQEHEPETAYEDVAVPQGASAHEAPSFAHSTEGTPSRGPAGPGFAGREDAYRALERAALYLRALEPHSPAPYLALRAVAWGEKSLSELIHEFMRNGLDLEALSNLLGLGDAEL